MDEYLEEKKELIKENFKIKNQLQVLNSEYENIKRIYNKLLEEHLDLQFSKNFDKVLIIQDELELLKSTNSKLSDELINLKDEINESKLKEKEENFQKVKSLTEEGKILNEKLLEKDGEIERLLEQLKSYEKNIEELEYLKLQGEEKAKIQEEEFNGLQVKIDKLGEEKRALLEEKEELNASLEENEKNLQGEREKYALLENDFEETLEALESIQSKEENSKEKIEQLEKQLEEINLNFETLKNEKESQEKLLEEANEKEEVLKNQILQNENKNQEQLEYIRAMEEELDKNIKLLNLMKIKEEELEEKILDYEKNKEETRDELLNLKGRMKEAEDLLLFNEKSNVVAMNTITEFEEKVANFEKIIAEKNEEMAKLSSEKQEDNSKSIELQQELDKKNEEISKLNARIKEFEYAELFASNDNLELSEEKEEILERIRISEEVVKKLEEKLREKEVAYTRSIHKNYDFRMITGKMLANFLEEQIRFKKDIKNLGKKLEEKISENYSLEERLKNLSEEKLALDKILEKKTLISKDNRVDIKNIFGHKNINEDKGPDILGSIINNLENRKEFHLYTTGDLEKEEGLRGNLIEENSTDEVKLDKELLGSISEENLSENTVKEEFENLFVQESSAEVLEEVNRDETVKFNSSKKFVENKDIFTKDKYEEFLDFLRFMLPQAIEAEAPLLEKDMMYFMVSFAFYNYKGDNFWEQLLDKLGVVGSDRIRYKNYLNKEMQTIIKMHSFYEVPEEIEDRVGATIVMHSLVPLNQISTYVEGIKNIYDFDLKGELDRYTFQRFLRKRLQEDRSIREIKSLSYLRKSNNLDKLIDYSYEILILIDAKEHGMDKKVNLCKELTEKIQELLDKNSLKKSIFNFGTFSLGKK